MTHRTPFIAGLIFFFGMAASVAWSQEAEDVKPSVRALSIRELDSRAANVVLATVQGTWASLAEANVLEVKLFIDETWRGGLTGKVTLRLFQPWAPVLKPAEQVLLFLPKVNGAGLVAPIGLSNGIFRVSPAGEGVHPALMNDLGNEGICPEGKSWTDVYPHLSDHPNLGRISRSCDSQPIPLDLLRFLIRHHNPAAKK